MTETLSKDLAGLVERWREDSKIQRERQNHEGICFCPHCMAAKSREVCADELSALLDQHAVAEPSGMPWAYAIETPGGDMYDGEYAVFGDELSCLDQVGNLNDDLDETAEQYKSVALYRTSAHAAEQPKLKIAQLNVALMHARWDGPFDPQKAVDEINALLAAPVAPPPPPKEKSLAPGEQPPRAIHDEGMYFDPDDVRPPVQERESDEGFDDWFQASEWYRPGVSLQLIRCAKAAWATAAKQSREGAPEREVLKELLNWSLVDGSADAYNWRGYWKPKILNALAAQPEQQKEEK